MTSKTLLAGLAAGLVLLAGPAGRTGLAEQAPHAAGGEGLPDYPLEILNIGPAGTMGLEPSNRIFRAYPGIPYEIRAAVIGGTYPYLFRLSEAPKGMQVEPHTGVITWPDPQESSGARLEVTDAGGRTAVAEWTINVTKEGFLFLDAENGKPADQGGKGTIEEPFRTIADFYPDDERRGLRTSAYTDYFVYFRKGAYKLDGFKSGWGGLDDKRWMNFRDQHPNVLAAYPGEEATIDCESKYSLKVYPQPGFWIEGLRFRGMKDFGYALEIEAGGVHCTVRKVDFEGLGPTEGHENQSFIRILIGRKVLERLVVQDCRFHDLDHGSGIKLYAIHRALIEGNTFTHFRDPGCRGANLDGAVAMKVCVRRCVFRGNLVRDFAGGRAVSCLFSQPYRGNYYEGVSENEVCFNVVTGLTDGAQAISINAASNPGSFHVYRNTIEGGAVVNRGTDGSGPFVFTRNVFVRPGGGDPIAERDSREKSRIIATENVVLRPDDLDADLLPKDARLLGAYGHHVPRRPEPRLPSTPDR
jgi:hypothetical protein